MVVRVGSMATVSCKPKLLSIVLQYDCVCDVHLANVVLIQHPLQKSPPSGRTTLFPFFASAFLQAVGKAWWWYFLIAPPQHNDFGFLSHWILSYGHDLWIHSPSEANSTSRFAGSHTSLYIEGKKKRCKLRRCRRNATLLQSACTCFAPCDPLDRLQCIYITIKTSNLRFPGSTRILVRLWNRFGWAPVDVAIFWYWCMDW